MQVCIICRWSSAYEFASARIPQLVTILDKHQFKIANMIRHNNCGKISDFDYKLKYKETLFKFENFFTNSKQLINMSKNSKKLIKESTRK